MIMSFSGSIAFTVVEEVVSSSYTVSNEVVYGDPVVLDYSVASLSNGSITWMLNGVKYTVFSDDLSNDELVKVANSVYETNEK